MHEQDTPGSHEDFDAFVADHPELEELRYFDPAEDDALAAIGAAVTADFAHWSYRLRWHLVDWLDRTLLPIGN